MVCIEIYFSCLRVIQLTQSARYAEIGLFSITVKYQHYAKYKHFKETNIFSPLSCKDSVLWGTSVTEIEVCVLDLRPLIKPPVNFKMSMRRSRV